MTAVGCRIAKVHRISKPSRAYNVDLQSWSPKPEHHSLFLNFRSGLSVTSLGDLNTGNVFPLDLIAPSLAVLSFTSFGPALDRVKVLKALVGVDFGSGFGVMKDDDAAVDEDEDAAVEVGQGAAFRPAIAGPTSAK